MVSQRVINIIKKVTQDFLTETCTIERETLAENHFGGRKHEWETVATAVACRVIMTSSRQVNMQESVGSQEALTDMYRLIVPAGTTLEVNYRVTVDGIVFQVVSVLTARTDETDRQAVLTRVRT